ncbi:phosphomevalonate kinase, putative [Babesia ovis]|uniref:Phosphomevalonate kinase, putative n=1 Tax=Babesia ovis TaxID=5869 RepID=A0A9W5WTT4_BABOV|nr:phosphomevalonate kinase, putative [Babesia ovis]
MLRTELARIGFFTTSSLTFTYMSLLCDTDIGINASCPSEFSCDNLDGVRIDSAHCAFNLGDIAAPITSSVPQSASVSSSKRIESKCMVLDKSCCLFRTRSCIDIFGDPPLASSKPGSLKKGLIGFLDGFGVDGG